MTTAVERSNSSPLVRTKLQGPLFVLSVWRSGSSLLYTLLNQHSKIALLYEGDLPRLHLFLFGRFRSGAWRERWEFWNQGPSRHGIAIESMPANVTNAWEATRIVYQEMARRKQAIIWGEKTPHWYDCPLRMAEKFPDARFIFLWRDMNAVMESIARAALSERFFRKAGFANRALLGNEKLRQACDVLKTRGRPVYEVNYEDLTANTSECMQQICHFLEVPFESRVISLRGPTGPPYVQASIMQWSEATGLLAREDRLNFFPRVCKLKLAATSAVGSGATTVTGPSIPSNCRKVRGHRAWLNFGATGSLIKVCCVGTRWSQ